MKKIIIILLVLLFGVVFGFITSTKKQSPGPTPTSTAAQPSAFLIVTPMQQPTYELTDTFTAPLSVSEYIVGQLPSLESIASMVSKQLGFLSSPTKTSGSRGSFLIWNESGKSLVVGGDPLEISYVSGRSPTGPMSPTTTNYSDVSDRFLGSFSSLFGLITPSSYSSTYIRPTNNDPLLVSSPEDATVVLLNYRLLLDNSILLTRAARSTSTSVGINSNGEILSFRTYVFPPLTKTGRAVPLLSFSNVKDSLLSGRGALLEFSYKGGEQNQNIITQPGSPPSISKVDEIQLGYYYLPGSSTLLPVYLFIGEGRDNKNDLLTTTTVVSAVK